MGIDIGIRKELREGWVPSAFETSRSSMRHDVVLDDVMTRVFTLYGPSAGGTFTGEQFFEAFYKPIREAIFSDQVSVYVAICDDQRGVPSQKSVTQQQRAESSKIAAYPADLVLDARGIKKPGGLSEPFLTQRLFRTRSLRLQVWQLMLYYLKQQNFPAGHTVVFDFDREGGPWVFHGCRAAVQVPQLKHELGEADMAVPFYVNLFPKKRIYIMTSDTDTLPILMMSIPKDRQIRDVFWVYSDKRNVTKLKRKAPGTSSDKLLSDLVYVDLVTLRNSLPGSSLMLDTEQFLLFTLLCGTDFVFKKWCFSWFGLFQLREAAMRSENLLKALHDQDKPKTLEALRETVHQLLSDKLNCCQSFIDAQPKPQQKRLLRRLVAKEYLSSTEQRKCVYDGPLIQASMSYIKRHTYPSDEDFELCAQALLFNFNYWTCQPHSQVTADQAHAWFQCTQAVPKPACS